VRYSFNFYAILCGALLIALGLVLGFEIVKKRLHSAWHCLTALLLMVGFTVLSIGIVIGLAEALKS
jgi:hypothetical protein